ncbi:MAG: response regulator, partial [Thermoleophilia bacterium]|nr:response regulator [Thermoleophilia bacterium]
EVIDRQVGQLARLVDDLLDVSRITRGMIRLKKEVVDPAPILDAAVEAARPLIEERKHRLTLDYAPGTLRVEADPTRLEQIVLNLVSNAAKYTENGGRIRVSAGRAGPNVVIEVADTGVGIPPELLPRMFELFTQADRTLARSEGGLGIGLTLVKSLTELHGGRVEALSDGIGRGSTFRVHVPSATAEAAGGRPAAGRGMATAARPSSILVVDDNVDTALAMGRILRLLGHDVRVVHDGHAAIASARERTPDLVLLDIGLPGMDGYEVARRLRADGGCAGAVVVAVSGYGQPEDVRRSRAAGFDHHLVKPVDHDALFALLEQRAARPDAS